MGEATSNQPRAASSERNFNPRFPWGKRRTSSQGIRICITISIHASRGGSDRNRRTRTAPCNNFNPRFPWGKRPLTQIQNRPSWKFQSTLPVGEATLAALWLLHNKSISIHASRGGSDVNYFGPYPGGTISIHASRGGSDLGHWEKAVALCISIHASRGGSDGRITSVSGKFQISIHASRGGSDSHYRLPGTSSTDFNPRFPWGKRLL